MTREEAKKLLPIIKAFSEGMTVQQKCAESWVKVDEDCDFSLSASEYRIKNGAYRPFANTMELWKEMPKHPYIGFILTANDELYQKISSINSRKILFH